MGFASSWLHSRSIFPELVKEAPHQNTGIIVVIPSFDEPHIIQLLNSLNSCYPPECRVEVIIIVNAPPAATGESLKNNLRTVNNIKQWKDSHVPFFSLFPVDVGQPSIKEWGVGLARRAGMDEALRRFDLISRREGIIVNLDADCLVSQNYFISLESELLKRKERNGCSVFFEHPLSGDDYPDEIYEAIIQYELHLRYYFQALKYTGFPFVFHTVGSAIAVKALAYVKAGGMNRRQAGEDFYFIQKLLPSGGYFSLNSATVFPSPRISARVPFGTGPAVEKMVNSEEKAYYTYNPQAFTDLKRLFGLKGKSYISNDIQLVKSYNDFPDSVKSFIGEENWKSKIIEIKENTSTDSTFKKRFFQWFNMFRIVKYLNYSHLNIYRKIPVLEATAQLLKLAGKDGFPSDAHDLLLFLRQIEKSGS